MKILYHNLTLACLLLLVAGVSFPKLALAHPQKTHKRNEVNLPADAEIALYRYLMDRYTKAQKPLILTGDLKHRLKALQERGPIDLDVQFVRWPHRRRLEVTVNVRRISAFTERRIEGWEKTSGRLEMTKRSGHWTVTHSRLTDMDSTELSPDLESAAYLYAIRRWVKDETVQVSFNVLETVLARVRNVVPKTHRDPLKTDERTSNVLLLAVFPAFKNPVVPGSNGRAMFLCIDRSRTIDGVTERVVVKATKLRSDWRFQEMPSSPISEEAQIVLYSFLANRGKHSNLIIADPSNTVTERLRSQHIAVIPKSEFDRHETDFQKRGYLNIWSTQVCWLSEKSVYVNVALGLCPPGNDITYSAYGTIRLRRRSGYWEATDMNDRWHLGWDGE